MSLPYESASAGDKALAELQRMLAKFGCSTFGTLIDAERGVTAVQFRWRGRSVNLEASWKGYAAAWLQAHPYTSRTRGTRHEYEQKALKQAQISVCSVLRDWVKEQTTAIECGVVSFEAAFFSHLLLPSGERVIDRVQAVGMLPPTVDHDSN